MARNQSVTVGSQTTSAPIPINWRATNFGVGIGCKVNSGTLTYQVEHTFDDIYDSTVTPVWFVHDTISAKTANDDGNYAFPVRACRLNVTAWTSGSVTMTIIEGN